MHFSEEKNCTKAWVEAKLAAALARHCMIWVVVFGQSFSTTSSCQHGWQPFFSVILSCRCQLGELLRLETGAAGNILLLPFPLMAAHHHLLYFLPGSLCFHPFFPARVHHCYVAFKTADSTSMAESKDLKLTFLLFSSLMTRHGVVRCSRMNGGDRGCLGLKWFGQISKWSV